MNEPIRLPPRPTDGSFDPFAAYRMAWDMAEMALAMIAIGPYQLDS